MAQSSYGFNTDPEEDDRADSLPLDTQDRASTNIQSPDFALPKEEPVPAAPQPQSFGTPLSGALGNYSVPEVPQQQEPYPQQQQVEPPRLTGAESPDVAQALQQVNQPPPAMAMPKRGYEQEWLDVRDRNARENARQQSGIHHFLKSRGVEMEVLPDGSEQVATHQDGSPRFKADMSAPQFDQATGKWLVQQRDDRGRITAADVNTTKGIVHTDPETGLRFFMGPNKTPVDMGERDMTVVRSNAVKAARSDLYARENEASYQATRLRAEVMEPAAELVRQMQAQPAIEASLGGKSKSMRAVENTITAYMPGRENGTLGEQQGVELDEALAAKDKFLRDNPAYGPAGDTLKGAKAEIRRLDAQRAADRNRRITSILNPNASAAMIAGLPDVQDQQEPGVADPGDIAHETAAVAADQGTTQTRALVAVLKRSKANGMTMVGSQPIDEAIAAAKNPPKRQPPAPEAVRAAPESAGFLSSAGATLRKTMYDTAATATDAAGNLVEKSQDPFSDAPAFLRDNQPRLDAARARLAEITAPATNLARRTSSLLSTVGLGANAGPMSDEEAALTRKINRYTMNPGWAQAVKDLQKEGADSYAAYDISPEAGNPLAQIGRGAGGFLAMAPTLSIMPLAVAQMAGNAYEAKYSEVEAAAPKDADPDQLHQDAQRAALKEAVKQAPQIAAYLVGGQVAGGVVSKLLPAAGPLTKAIATGVASTAANMTVSAGTRALQGQPIAPTLEGTTQDVLFGAHAGVEAHHGAAELGKYIQAALAIRDQATPSGGQTADPAQAKQAADFLAQQNPKLVAKIEARMQRVVAAAAGSPESSTPEGSTLSDPSQGAAKTAQASDSLASQEGGKTPSTNPAETGPGAQAKAFTATLRASDRLAPEIEAAGENNPVRAQLNDEQNAHQVALHQAQKRAVEEVPAPVRARIAEIVGGDGPANEAHFAEQPKAAFQAAHVGKELRDAYTTPEQQAALEQVKTRMVEHGPTAEFIADQHVGMLAGKDLLAIATGNGEVPQERVAELGRLGLVEPGEDGTPHVTHDALPLLPKGFTGRLLTAHDNYRVKSLHGEKLAGTAAMVRSGQAQLESALHGRAEHVREQAAPKPYHVRVEFTDHAGQAREKIIRPKGATNDEQALTQAMVVAEKRGMKVTNAEVTTQEKEALRRLKVEKPQAASSPRPQSETRTEAASSPTEEQRQDQSRQFQQSPQSPKESSNKTSTEHIDPLAGRKNVFTKADPKTLAPEERGAIRTVMQFLRQNRAELRALGIDPDPEFGHNTRDSSGLAVTSAGKLLLDGKQLREHFDALGGRDKALEWVKAAVVEEEGLHRHQFKAAENAGLDFAEHYAAIREEAPADMVEHARETYEGFDELAPHEQGAELERMVLQQKWHGSLTERMFKSIERILAYLKGLKIESPLLKESIARVEAVRDEALARSRETGAHESDQPKVEGPGSKQRAASSATPYRAVDSETLRQEIAPPSPEPATPAAEAQALHDAAKAAGADQGHTPDLGLHAFKELSTGGNFSVRDADLSPETIQAKADAVRKSMPPESLGASRAKKRVEAEQSDSAEREQARRDAEEARARQQRDQGMLFASKAQASKAQTETPEFKKWFGKSKAVDAEGRPQVVYHGTSYDFTAFDPSKRGKGTAEYGHGLMFFTDSQDVASEYASIGSPAKRDAMAEVGRTTETFDEIWGAAHDKISPRWSLSTRTNRELLHHLNRGEEEGKITRKEYDDVLAALDAKDEAEAKLDGIDNEEWKAGTSGNGARLIPSYLALRNPVEYDAGGFGWNWVMRHVADEIASGGHDGAIVKNVVDSPSASEEKSTVYIATRPEQIKSATGNSGAFDPANPSMLAASKAKRDKDSEPVEVGSALLDKDTPIVAHLDAVRAHPEAEAIVVADKNGVHWYDLTGEEPEIMASAKVTGDQAAIDALTDTSIPKVRNLEDLEDEDIRRAFPDADKALVVVPMVGRLDLYDEGEDPIATARLRPQADSLAASKAKSAKQKEAERLAKLRETRAGFAAETETAKPKDWRDAKAEEVKSIIAGFDHDPKKAAHQYSPLVPAHLEEGSAASEFIHALVDAGFRYEEARGGSHYVQAKGPDGDWHNIVRFADHPPGLGTDSGVMFIRKNSVGYPQDTAHAAAMRWREKATAAPSPEPHVLTKPEGRSVINAYHHLSRTTGFPAIAIAELADQSGIPLDRLKQQLLRSQKAGSVVLSTGDWSLSSDKVKSGVIEDKGQKMLQVRFLNDAGGMAAARAQTKTPEFKKFFSDSKVVDKNGEPKILYTGQPRGITELPESTRSELPLAHAFLTDDRDVAGKYSGAGERDGSTDFSTGRKGRTYRVFAKIEKPIDLDENLDENEWKKRLAPPNDVKEQIAAKLEYIPEEKLAKEARTYGVPTVDKDGDPISGSRLADLVAEKAVLNPDSGVRKAAERETLATALGLEQNWLEGYDDEPARVDGYVLRDGFAEHYFPDNFDIGDVIRAKWGAIKGRGYYLQDALNDSPTGQAFALFPEIGEAIAKEGGHDGYVHTDTENGGKTWIPFSAQQVKSATSNRGTFDPNDPNMLHASKAKATDAPSRFLYETDPAKFPEAIKERARAEYEGRNAQDISNGYIDSWDKMEQQYRTAEFRYAAKQMMEEAAAAKKAEKMAAADAPIGDRAAPSNRDVIEELAREGVVDREALSGTDSDARTERAGAYFAIGHDAEGGMNWIYDPASRSIKAKQGGTHGSNFGHDVADRSFKGWYDPERNVISVVFPEHEERKLDHKPTVNDIPASVYDKLRAKFGKNTDMALFASKSNADPAAARKEGRAEMKETMQAKVEATRAKERERAQVAKQDIREKAAAKVAELRDKMSAMVSKVTAYQETLRKAEKAGAAGVKRGVAETRAELEQADRWFSADMNRVRDDMVDFVKSSLPPEERGHFISQIASVLTDRPGILRGENNDATKPFQAAFKLMGKIQLKGEQVYRASVAQEVRDIARKALDSPSVDINYKAKVRALIGQHQFAKLSATHRAELESRRAFVQRKEAAGEAHGLPESAIAELRRLDQPHISELPTAALEALRDKMQDLADQGRLTVQLREREAGRRLAEDHAAMLDAPAIKYEDKPLIADLPPDAQGRQQSLPAADRLRNAFTKAQNQAAKTARALLPIDALFDQLEGGNGTYSGGYLFRRVRGPIDLGYNATDRGMQDLDHRLNAIIRKHKLTAQDSRRIGTYAAAMQEGGRERLLQVMPEAHLDRVLASITSGEMEAYREMRDTMQAAYAPLREQMRQLYNQDVVPVDNYFPMVRDWNEYAKTQEAPRPVDPKSGETAGIDELHTWRNVVEDVRPTNRTNVAKGFTIERQPGALTPIKIDAFDVYRRHMRDVYHLLHTQADLKRIGQVVRSPEFADRYGRAGREKVVDWLDTVARNGGVDASKRIAMLDYLRTKTSVGMVAFRAVSMLKHISNAGLAIHHVGAGWYTKALSNVLRPEVQDFMRRNMAETFERAGGEQAIDEAVRSSRIAGLGFLPIRKIDQINAQASALGYYLKDMHAKGFSMEEALKVDVQTAKGERTPAEEAARTSVQDALVRMRRIVASPDPKDSPQVLSRGTGIGGNVSWAKSIFQFGNIFLDRWSNVRHDLYGAGLKKGNVSQSSTIAIGLLAAVAAEAGITLGMRNFWNAATGNQPKDEKDYAHDFLEHAAKQFPFMGQAMSMWERGDSGIPVLDAPVQVVQEAHRTMGAKDARGTASHAIRTAGGLASLFGVPGAGQVSDVAAKSVGAKDENDVQRIMREGGIKRQPEKPEGQPARKDIVAQVRAGAKPQEVFKAGVATGMKAEQVRSAVKEGMKAPETVAFERLPLQAAIEVFKKAQNDPKISPETRRQWRAILQRKHAAAGQLKAA